MELPADGEAPWVYTYKREGKEQVNFTRSETQVDVYNMRDQQDSFTLKDKGIELHKLEVPSDLDWENEKEVSTSSSLLALLCLLATLATLKAGNEASPPALCVSAALYNTHIF